MALVICEDLQPGIVKVTMNRPESLNALSVGHVTALQETFVELGARRDCRVIILTGAGRGFCAGADVKDKALAPGGESLTRQGYVVQSQQQLVDMLLTIRELEKPVIAAVNGTAVGGGLALSLVSDIRIASKSARFGAASITVGLSACDVGVNYLLPRIVGASRAAELMLTGRVFDAQEACRIGMAHDVVEDSQLMAAALQTAELIVGNNEYGVMMTKKSLWANLDEASLRQAVELENRTQVLGYFSGNMEKAMRAFTQQRVPQWKPS